MYVNQLKSFQLINIHVLEKLRGLVGGPLLVGGLRPAPP